MAFNPNPITISPTVLYIALSVVGVGILTYLIYRYFKSHPTSSSSKKLISTILIIAVALVYLVVSQETMTTNMLMGAALFGASAITNISLPEENEFSNSVSRLMVDFHRKMQDLSKRRKIGGARRETYLFTKRELRRWAQFISAFQEDFGITKAFVKGASYVYGDRLESVEDREQFLAVLKGMDLAALLKEDKKCSKDALESLLRLELAGGKDAIIPNALFRDTVKGTIKIVDTQLPVNNRIPFKDSEIPDQEKSYLVPVRKTLNDLEKIAQGVILKDSILLVGETGAGKTSLVRYLAALTNNSLKRFNLNGQTDKMEFIGGYRPAVAKQADAQEDQSMVFKWEDGILLKAIKEGHWILLDEINLAEPDVIERIRYLLDDDGYLVVSEYQGEKWVKPAVYQKMLEDYLRKNHQFSGVLTAQAQKEAQDYFKQQGIFCIHPDFRLFATMNPEEYEGRKSMSPALRNKFNVKWIDELSDTEIRIILENNFGIKEKDAQMLIGFYKGLKEISGKGGKLGRSEGVAYYFTVRDMKRLAARIQKGSGQKSIVDFQGMVISEVYEVFGSRLRQEEDRRLFDYLVKESLGLVNREDKKVQISFEPGTVHIGKAALEVKPFNPDSDNKSAKLALVPTALRHLELLAGAIQMNERPLLVGPTGSGKTALLRYLASLTNHKFVRINLDGQTDTSELIGKFGPKEGASRLDLKWIPGRLLRAMQEGSWVLLDEFNLAYPDIVERLNSLLDEDRYIILTEYDGRRIEVAPGFRLFCAMNPERYRGRNKISLAMRNKFTELWIDSPYNEDELVQISRFYLTDKDICDFPAIDQAADLMAEELSRVYTLVRSMIENGEIGRRSLGVCDGSEYNFSLRDLKDWVFFVRRMKGELGIMRSLVEGALYVYRDRLKGEEDKRAFKEKVMLSMRQVEIARQAGEEVVDIQKLDILEEEGRSFIDQIADDSSRDISIETIQRSEILEKFDAETFGMAGVRGVIQIREKLSNPATFADGVRGFALLPPEKALALIEFIWDNPDVEVRQALIEVIGYRYQQASREDERDAWKEKFAPRLYEFITKNSVLKIKVAAALVLEEFGFERTEGSQPRPENLSFRETIGRILKLSPEDEGDYLGIKKFSTNKFNIFALTMMSLAIAAVLWVSGVFVWWQAILIALIPAVLIGAWLLGFYYVSYNVLYIPQYNALNKRYKSLPLNLSDFYQLFGSASGILGDIGHGQDNRKLYFLSIPGKIFSAILGASLAVASFLAMSAYAESSGIFVSGVSAVEITALISGAISGFSLGWIIGSFALMLAAAIAELVYEPSRYAAGITDSFSGGRKFEMNLPYSDDVKQELFNYQEAVDTAQSIKAIDEIGNVLRIGAIKQDAAKCLVTIDDVGISFSTSTNQLYVPTPESAGLIEVISAVRNIKKLAFSVLLDDPVLLIGQTGVGKTSLIKYLASLTKHNFRRFNLNGQTDKTELIGGYKPDESGAFNWIDGVLLQAMQNGWWLVLDEINLAESQVLERLNSLLDARYFMVTEHDSEEYIKADDYEERVRKIAEDNIRKNPFLSREKAENEARILLKSSRVNKIHPEFRLFATMNPAEYAGRKILSPALMNRFRVKWVDDYFYFEKLAILDQVTKRKFPNAEIILGRDYGYASAIFDSHDEIRYFSERGMLMGTESGSYVYTFREVLRLVNRLDALIGNYQSGNLVLDEGSLKDILCQEFLQIHGDRIRDRATQEIFRDCLHTLPEFNEDNDLAIDSRDAAVVNFGQLKIQKHSGVGPYVPGDWAKLTHTGTTLRILKKLAKSILAGEKVLLVGPTGSGKTSYIRYLAYLLGANFWRINLDAQTDTSELIGKYIPLENSKGFKWEDGALIEAMKNGWWVLLDEINLAEPDILERLNPLLDDDGCLEVGENKGEKWLPAKDYDAKFVNGLAPEDVHRIHPNFRIFAAMNPERYSGRNRLSLAMHNRFTEIWVPALDSLLAEDASEMIEIVEGYLPNINNKREWAKRMVVLHSDVMALQEAATGNDVLHGFRGGGFEGYQFSLRELKSWAKYIAEFIAVRGIEEAFSRGAFFIYFARLTTEDDRKKFLSLAEKSNVRLNAQINENSISRAGGKLKAFGFELSQGNYVADETAKIVYTPLTLMSLYQIFQGIILKEPLLLIGPTGVGKTSFVRHLAELAQIKFFRLNLSGQTEKSELIGGFKPNEEGIFVWQPGALIEAMRNGWWILLDEINLASPQVVERINSLLDDDVSLVIRENKNEKWVSGPEYAHRIEKIMQERGVGREEAQKLLERESKIFPIHPNFRLFATMNPAEYAGRKVFSPALLNRFRIVWLRELEKIDLGKIIKKIFSALPIDSGLLEKILEFHISMKKKAEEVNQKGAEEKLSYTIRNLTRWLWRVNNSPLRDVSNLNKILALEAKEVYGNSLRPDLEAHQELITAMLKWISEYFGDWEDQNYGITRDEVKGKVSFGEFTLEQYGGNNGQSVGSNGLYEVETTKKLMKKLAKALYSQEHILLVGPTGGGKTAIVKHMAFRLGMHIETVDLDGQTDTAQLIGHFAPTGDKNKPFKWVDGLLIQAMKNGWWILLDEINLAEPDIIERINSILDDDRFLMLTEHENEKIKVHPDFRLIAAMNPATYSGRKVLSLAMLNKFSQIWVPDEMLLEEEVQITQKYLETTRLEMSDSARPLPGQSMPSRDQVNAAIQKVGWDNAQALAEDAAGIKLAASYLKSIDENVMAEYLEYLAKAGLIRAGPFESFLASTYTDAQGQEGIALSKNYLPYNSIIEVVASLIHEIGATSKFNLDHSNNADREAGFKKSKGIANTDLVLYPPR
jgi:MoxR-like ATPase